MSVFLILNRQLFACCLKSSQAKAPLPSHGIWITIKWALTGLPLAVNNAWHEWPRIAGVLFKCICSFVCTPKRHFTRDGKSVLNRCPLPVEIARARATVAPLHGPGATSPIHNAISVCKAEINGRCYYGRRSWWHLWHQRAVR